MPPREWGLRIEDIRRCIEKLERYTRGLDFDGFVTNEMLLEAVERNFTIIGEAARHVPTAISSATRRFPGRTYGECATSSSTSILA